MIMGGSILPLSTDWIRNSIKNAELKGEKKGRLDGKREFQLVRVRIISDQSGISPEEAMTYLNITGEDREY